MLLRVTHYPSGPEYFDYCPESISYFDWLFHAGNDFHFQQWVRGLLKDIKQLSQLLGWTFIRLPIMAAKYDVSVRWLEEILSRLVDIGVLGTRRSSTRRYWISKKFLRDSSDHQSDRSTDQSSDHTSDRESKRSPRSASTEKTSKTRSSAEKILDPDLLDQESKDRSKKHAGERDQSVSNQPERRAEEQISSVVSSSSSTSSITAESEAAAILREYAELYPGKVKLEPVTPVSNSTPSLPTISSEPLANAGQLPQVKPVTTSPTTKNHAKPHAERISVNAVASLPDPVKPAAMVEKPPAIPITRVDRSDRIELRQAASVMDSNHGSTTASQSRYPFHTVLDFIKAEAVINPKIYDPSKLAGARYRDGKDDVLIEAWLAGSYKPQPMSADNQRGKPPSQGDIDRVVGMSPTSKPLEQDLGVPAITGKPDPNCQQCFGFGRRYSTKSVHSDLIPCECLKSANHLDNLPSHDMSECCITISSCQNDTFSTLPSHDLAGSVRPDSIKTANNNNVA